MGEKHTKKHSFRIRKKILFFIIFPVLLVDLVFIGLYFYPRNGQNKFTEIIQSIEKWHNQQVLKDVQAQVLPKKGFQTKIVLGDIVPKMVTLGVINMKKMQDLYTDRGGMPKEEKDILTKSTKKPLTVTPSNATWLVNILWPIGLSNHMDINAQSPVNGADVNNFASTGGWTLGNADSGGVYFNRFPLIALSAIQQKRVKAIADNTYRPCCNNSTFFQDCNHGSAAMAIIELGVEQGLSDTEIYKTVLDFNSFWFSQNYLETALYFKVIKNMDWNTLDPKLPLSKDYSSITGWMIHIAPAVEKIPGLLPQQQNGASCGA